MNIYDIAKEAGVSIATVSRVINNKGNVSEKTRMQVLEIIQRSGYTPNIFARGLGLNSIKVVGVICSDVSDLFYAKAVSIIENELREVGYVVILCCTGQNIKDKRKYLELLLSKRVDAIILVGSIFKEIKDNSHIEKAAETLPIILINSYMNIPNVYCVLCDETEIQVSNVTQLKEKGYDRILYLYDSNTFSGMAKLNGFKLGLLKNELPNNPDYIIKTERSIHSAEAAVTSALEKGLSFNAVMTSEDILAAGAMKAATAQGLRIPQDLAVIGFNNSLIAECTTPTLSSVDNKIENLCSLGCKMLMDVLDGKKVPNKMLISCDLVTRESYL